VAWERADDIAREAGEIPVPGHAGLMAEVPTVAEPATEPKPGGNA
jgi:hypothetical protein